MRQVPGGQAALVVEMNRTSGDPVLLRKPAAGGFAAGALPSVQVRLRTASCFALSSEVCCKHVRSKF